MYIDIIFLLIYSQQHEGIVESHYYLLLYIIELLFESFLLDMEIEFNDRFCVLGIYLEIQ